MAYGLDVTEGMARADKYLKLFRLDEKLDWFPTQFSKGMKQKVMIICAFIVTQVFSLLMNLSWAWTPWQSQT